MRPSGFDTDYYPWVLARLPKPHPVRDCAIFVVHGMGEQKFAETAATLRDGFEQVVFHGGPPVVDPADPPPPYIRDGYWGDYDDVAETFPGEWSGFSQGERTFFSDMWQRRVHGPWSTLGWFLGKQLGLLGPKTWNEIAAKRLSPLALLIYLPLQVICPVALVLMWLRFRRVLVNVLADVRLYCAPRGMIEGVIVQGIDRRVAERFLHMLGMDGDFRSLPDRDLLRANQDVVVFRRVVWVAHSLGTVVSFNALSDLFHRAAAIDALPEIAEHEERKANVRRFRESLAAFVTLGSPLDKIAFLCGDQALKPWPAPRDQLLRGENAGRTDWWINVYNCLDPVSGALENPLLAGDPDTTTKHRPRNVHVFRPLPGGAIPGVAHIAYWRHPRILEKLLKLAYGDRYPAQSDPDLGGELNGAMVVGANLLWLVLVLGVLLALIVSPCVAWSIHSGHPLTGWLQWLDPLVAWFRSGS